MINHSEALYCPSDAQAALSDRASDAFSVAFSGAQVLSFLKDQYGMKNQITHGMSKKEMAAAIGATGNPLRILANLKSSGMMVWRRENTDKG